ncbi:MAG: hypothetical protein ACYSRR_06980, partial [Planctomycetota bacterium]
TPLYIGSPNLLALKTRCLFWKTVRKVGGGFLEPFAFQSTGPAVPPSITPPGSALMEMPASPNPYTLWQASGMSSAAYAADVASIDKKLLPKATYWPPADIGKSPPRTFRFGDGGNLENFGLLALLQRKVKNIIVFINTETALEKVDENHYKADSDIAPLFGYTTKSFPHNTVFLQHEYQPLLKSLYEAQQKGGMAMAQTHYEVQPNDWWGIQGYSVNIMWVYNALVNNWVAELSESVQKLVNEGAREHSGPLKDFPNYKTIMENFGDLVELTPPQVNLLADMFAWAIQQEPEPFKTWLAAGKSS